MSLPIYLGLQAAAAGHAVPRASRRHVHLALKPFVVAGYHLPGEAGAPIGLICGSDYSRPVTLTAADPQDFDLRWQMLTAFAGELNRYFAQFTTGPAPRRSNRRTAPVRPPAAPQLVVPNEATAEWVCDLLGRLLRYRDLDPSSAMPGPLPIAGAHLSFLAEHRLPGSSLVLPVAQQLSEHWETGQLGTLDAHLASMLAWIDDPEHINEAEARLPAGPIPDSGWELRELADATRHYRRLVEHASREAATRPILATITDALLPAWTDCWRGLEILRRLPQASHVADRWNDDGADWSRHAQRVRAGEARFRRRPRQLQVFRRLSHLERLTANLDREMALDDPYIMARHVAAGDALDGQVLRVATTSPPTVVIRPNLEFMRPEGTELYWRAESEPSPTGLSRKYLTLTLARVEDSGDIVFTVSSGAVQRRYHHRLPHAGQHIVLSPFGPPEYRPNTLPTELPWTHAETEDE